MDSQLIINASLPEYRIALIENGELVDLLIERQKDRGIVGNIYKGKVVRVLPGMQAAFVDIGLDKAAFLYVDDIIQKTEEEMVDRHEDRDEHYDMEEEEETDFMSRTRKKGYHQQHIQELVSEGQEILVQVAKDPIGTKGARLTTHISIPGRNLVFMPTVAHIGVSRKIEDEEERKRLREIIDKMSPPKTGFIVRTAAEGQSYKKLKADMEFLVKLWKEIQRKNTKLKAPNLLYQELTIVLRTIRDYCTEEIDKVYVDVRKEFKQISKFVSRFLPSMKNKIELYQGKTPIFDSFGIEMEISRALDRKVWLKSGGYIVVDQAEALVAIDVNTGRYVGKRNLEETILKTNLEAVKEIAYQLRLRNCGGIIIIDFIDMEREINREKVYQTLEEALKKDKSKTNILKISELGLVEMTRKRTRDTIIRSLCEPCAYCEGKGYIRGKLTVCYEIFRDIEREGIEADIRSILVYSHPEIADMLLDEERETLDSMEQRLQKKITVKSDPSYHIEQFEVFGSR